MITLKENELYQEIELFVDGEKMDMQNEKDKS